MTDARFLRRLLPALSVLIGFGIFFMPADAAAQAAVGALVGNVSDESGGAVPGATITATEVRTSISRTAVSNAAGNYTFTNLSPGLYRVEGELVGFRKFSRDNVEVNVNTTVRVDIALTVGQLEESVMVTGEAPMLQTDRTDTGRIIQSEQITQLPLAFNRNFQGALAIVPGASRPFRPHSEFYNSHDSLSSNVNGQERQSNNVQLEGTDNSDNGGNLAFMIPSAEAIETVGVTTSNYDAEFGRAGGAVTNVTLKSGTNDLSGSLFTFGNTEATMARNPFTSLPPTDTTYVQAGFTLGGPIKRNKLFFFGDYVRSNDDSGRITRAHVPEAAFRTGDFSSAPTTIYDPATGGAAGVGRTPFPNKQIPANRISPIALRLLDKIPMPNVPGAPVGTINYEKPYVRSKRINQFDIKLTYQAAQNDNLSVRYSHQNAKTVDPGTFGVWGGVKDYSGSGTNPTYNMAINYNRVWSPSLVQEVRIGRTSHHNVAITEAHGMNLADEIGVPGANLNAFTSGPPTININSYHNFLIGFENSLPWDRAERVWTMGTSATKLWGNHTLKVGGDVRISRHMLDQVTHPRGEFEYRPGTTASSADSSSQNGFANAMAAFMLDVPFSIERGVVNVSDVFAPLDELHRGGRHKSVFTYVHDKWQLRPNITLDLGLRHEYYTPIVGFHDRGGMVNYDPETNTLRVAGYGDIPPNLGVESYWLNFNPRTGISWRLNDSNVVRAGYGVSAEGGPSSSGQFYPIAQAQLIEGPNAYTSPGSLATGIPAPSFAPIPDNGILPAVGPLLTQGFNNTLLEARHFGRLHSWNVAYQRTLPGAFTAEVAYVGNRADDPWSGENINAGFVVGADRAGQPLFVKYGRTGSTTVQVQDERPTSKYHSMQVKVDRRMRGGLAVTNSYTLGRAWDFSNNTPAHPNRFERGYGRTGFDVTHNFTSSFTYLLPWGPQGTWLREGALGRVLGDWQITGLFSAISGTPIGFSASASGLRAPNNSQTPDVTGKPKVLGGIGANDLWFDTSVFSAPAALTWGNVERNALLTGPGYVNLDASIVKIIRFGSRRAEIRADFFNALNTPHYANPNGSFGNANFGRVTGILDLTERMIRFGGRFLF
jgi:Carboxypeptidase regulatory-like domain